MQAIRRKKGESSEYFSVRLSHILCKFHITDLPYESDLLNIVFNSQVPLIQKNQDVCGKDDNSLIFLDTSSSIIDSDTFICSTQPLGEKIEVEEVTTSSEHYSPLEGETHNSFIQNLEPININESNEEEHIHDKFIRTDREVDCLNEQQDSVSIIMKIDQDELIINQTICSSFSDFCTNSSFDSIINEHEYVNYNFICFDNSIEKVEEEDMNLYHSTKCCLRKEINLF